MKKSQLVVGQNYQTKIGTSYQTVKLVNKREDGNAPYGMTAAKYNETSDVVVRTKAGNQIMRKASQLKPAPDAEIATLEIELGKLKP